jgi:tol-pal system protein YbgF
MKHSSLAFVAGLALLLLGAGVSPSAAASREQQQMMAELRMLQQQTQQLQLLLGTLTEALKTVTARIDEQAGLNRKAFADSKLLVDNVAGDVRVLREKIDDTNVRISTLSQEVEALRLAIPPAAPVPAPADPMAESGDGSTPATAPPAPAPGGLGMTPQRAYETAWADYAAGQWTLAIAGFETYIKTFPRADLADDAQLYIGHSYYNDGKYKEAIAAYEKVIADYPRGNAVPDAYYKMGLALDRTSQPDRARDTFALLVKNFPDSDAARLAKQAIERLNRPRE